MGIEPMHSVDAFSLQEKKEHPLADASGARLIPSTTLLQSAPLLLEQLQAIDLVPEYAVSEISHARFRAQLPARGVVIVVMGGRPRPPRRLPSENLCSENTNTY